MISNLLFAPLPASVPGPFIARLTRRWILFVDLAGSRARTVHELHRKYGPVVRLAPDELSFASLQSVKAIYGSGSTCVKSSAYDNFGRLGMFQMQDPAQHQDRQRRIAHVFAPGSLQQMEPLIRGVLDELMSTIEKLSGESVDALHWCRMTALDVSGVFIPSSMIFKCFHVHIPLVPLRRNTAGEVVRCFRRKWNRSHLRPSPRQRIPCLVLVRSRAITMQSARANAYQSAAEFHGSRRLRLQGECWRSSYLQSTLIYAGVPFLTSDSMATML